jgi:hypothetical protein
VADPIRSHIAVQAIGKAWISVYLGPAIIGQLCVPEDHAPEIMARLDSCTCPSGDGSLRWPCPMHPTIIKANMEAK